MRILLVGDAASLPAELTEFIADLGEDWQPLTATDGQAAMTAVAGMLGIGSPETIRTWIRRGQPEQPRDWDE